MNTPEEEKQILSDTDESLRNLMAACQEDDQADKSETNLGLEISTANNDEELVNVDPINFSGSSSSKSSEKSKKSRGTPTKSFPGTPRGHPRRPNVFSDEELEKLRKPLEIGWRREIVWRQGLTKSGTKNGDVYYYAPNTTQKLRSMPEVLAFCINSTEIHKENLELTGENFSFVRQNLQLGSPNEMERGAHPPGTPTKPKKTTSVKKYKATKIQLTKIKKEFDEEVLPETLQIDPEWRTASQASFPDSEAATPASSTTRTPSSLKRKCPDESGSGCESKDNDESGSENHLVVALPSIKKENEPFKKTMKKSDQKIKKSIEDVCQLVKSVQPSSPIEKSTSPPPPCPGQICDPTVPLEAVCANCMLAFHVRCAVKNGKILSGKKDQIFICNTCYDGTLIIKVPRVDSSTQFDDVTRAGDVPIKVVGQVDSRLLGPEKQSSVVNWMSDVCHYAQLLKMVFKNLTVVDLLRVRCICRTWKDIASLPELWRFASLDRCKISDWSKASVFFRQYQVQTLDFFGVRTTVKAFSEALKEMDFLTGFHFGCVVPCVLTSLKDSAKVLNRMEYLRVTVTEQRKCSPEDNEVVVDFELFKHMCKIKYLRIQSARGFVIKVQNLANLYFCEQLTSLSLLDIKDFSDADLQTFLKRMPLLLALEIGYCTKFTSKAYELISNLRKLERLRLECGESSALFNTLMVLPKLKFLCLTKFTLTESIMDIAAMKSLHNLTIWIDFDSALALDSFKLIIDNLRKFKNNLISFTLGVIGKRIALEKTKEILDISDLQNSSLNIRFATIDETRPGYLKSVKIDEFLKFGKKFIQYVDFKSSKDDFLASTR